MGYGASVATGDSITAYTEATISNAISSTSVMYEAHCENWDMWEFIDSLCLHTPTYSWRPQKIQPRKSVPLRTNHIIKQPGNLPRGNRQERSSSKQLLRDP